MNRYSYSGSLNTERCLSCIASTFTLQPAPLPRLNKGNMDHVGTDRHTCGEPDRATDGWQIPGHMGGLEPPRGFGAIEPTDEQSVTWDED